MRLSRSRARAGVTLLELLIVMGLTVILLGAIGYGFVAGLDMQQRNAQRKTEQDRAEALEQRITQMIQGAKLTEDAGDLTTYFVGATTDGGDTGELGCDLLTFTTSVSEIPMAALSSEDDFETQHQARGPVGGVAEVAFSTTPVGDPGDRAGLFERMQRPSDGDPNQGGLERLLAAEVERIGFQFWDGEQWAGTWDTLTGERRLPAAVRVSYVVAGREGEAVRTFIVPIPSSDVDSQNPANTGVLQ